jgi:hypothetical protein
MPVFAGFIVGLSLVAESLRLHNEIAALTEQLAEAEDRWCHLQKELERTA